MQILCHRSQLYRYVFTSDGPSKTTAINEMQVPTDVISLQRFLGMVNYLGKLIPYLSDISASLRELTHKDTAWSWYAQHQTAFEILKLQLASAPTLAYFVLKLPVTLTCDVSQYERCCLPTDFHRR